MTWDELTEEQKLEASAPRQWRERLPDRRALDAIEVAHIWAPATDQQVEETLLVSIGRYADGRLAEVFIDYPLREGERRKSDRTVNLGHDVATIVSIALQYGAPIEVLRRAVGRAEVNYMGTARLMPHTIIGTVLDALAAEAS